MNTTQKAEILYTFPKQSRFRFDSSGTMLLVCDYKTLSLITQKGDTAVVFCADRKQCIYTFTFSEDGTHVYIGVKIDDGVSDILRINITGGAVEQRLKVPLEVCEDICFDGDALVVFGKYYESYMEGDGHELYDEFRGCCRLQQGTGEYHLETDLDEREYISMKAALKKPEKRCTLPESVSLYTFQNDDTTFWDSRKFCVLYFGSEEVQSLVHEELPGYAVKQHYYPAWGLAEYGAYMLLIGYHPAEQA